MTGLSYGADSATAMSVANMEASLVSASRGVSAAAYSYDSSQNFVSDISIYTGQSVNQRPVAAIAILPNSMGVVPFSIGFDGTGLYDPDGSIVSYQWDFGDGSTGTGENASHTYIADGTYTATLTVTDNDGDYSYRHYLGHGHFRAN